MSAETHEFKLVRLNLDGFVYWRIDVERPRVSFIDENLWRVVHKFATAFPDVEAEYQPIFRHGRN